MDTSTCLSCDGRCCLSHVVPVTGADVRRIRDATEASPDSFTDFVSVADLESTHHDVALDDGYHYLVLKREDDACILLENDRCSIHEYKPMLCRLYPFFHSEEKEVQVRSNPQCAKRTTPTQRERKEIRDLCNSYTEDLFAYNNFVEGWNKASGMKSRQLFLDQLIRF